MRNFVALWRALDPMQMRDWLFEKWMLKLYFKMFGKNVTESKYEIVIFLERK
jgi:hypothetical protein